jgi:transcriptional regulator with XRE-family HTH domain
VAIFHARFTTSKALLSCNPTQLCPERTTVAQIQTDFGQLVKERRLLMGMSPEIFAQVVDCSGSYIRAIERGLQPPSQMMAQKILTSLDIDFYVEDELTLRLSSDSENGQVFKFKSTSKGRRGAKTLAKEKEDRFIALEARVSTLEMQLRNIF